MEFFDKIKSTFEGEWRSSLNVNNFEEKNGTMLFNMHILSYQNENDTMLMQTFVINDGKYMDNSYILIMHNGIFEEKNINYFSLDMDKKQMLGSFNTTINFRKLYDKTENYSMNKALIDLFIYKKIYRMQCYYANELV